MTPLPGTVSDTELIAFVDGWASLLEREDYEAAFRYTDHNPTTGWTPALIRDVIKAYGEADPDQRVTVEGAPTDVTQRKKVSRKSGTADGYLGYVWYDLNISGFTSDLTATFDLYRTDDGVRLRLSDIHVM
jgi:hypothetical protein